MGVTAKHEVDERTARVGDDVVGIVGCVCHEEDGTVGFWGNGEVEGGVAGAGVVDAAEPEAGARVVDGGGLVVPVRSGPGGGGPEEPWAAVCLTGVAGEVVRAGVR